MSNIVRVDDCDASMQYSQPAQANPWVIEGMSPEYLNTTHFTGSTGATVTFNFTGNSISVYGTTDSSKSTTPTISSYIIDGSSPSLFTTTVAPSVLYQQRFFQSPQLSNGEHTLVIEMISENGWYWLDYVEYTVLPNADETQLSTVVNTEKTTVTPQSSQVSTNAIAGSTSTIINPVQSSPSLSSNDNTNRPASTDTGTGLSTGTSVTPTPISSGPDLLPASSLTSTSFDTSQPTRTDLSNNNNSGFNGSTGPVSEQGGIKTRVGMIVGVVLGVLVFLLVVFAVIRVRRRRGIRRGEVRPYDVGVHKIGFGNGVKDGGGEGIREVAIDTSYGGTAGHDTDLIVSSYNSTPQMKRKSNHGYGTNGYGNAPGSSAPQVQLEPGQIVASASPTSAPTSSSHLTTSPNNHHTPQGSLFQSDATVILIESDSSTSTGAGSCSTNEHGSVMDMYNYEPPPAYRSNAP